MPDKVTETSLITQAVAMALPITLAVVGGAVRQFRKPGCNVRHVLVGGLTAAFTGIVVHCGLDGLDMDPMLKASIVGLSGYAGGDLLSILARKLCGAARKIEG
ncbi:MAG: phage holin family protein [Desulfovibrio sp.]